MNLCKKEYANIKVSNNKKRQQSTHQGLSHKTELSKRIHNINGNHIRKFDMIPLSQNGEYQLPRITSIAPNDNRKLKSPAN